MPLQRPTLQQIIDRTRTDIRSALGIATILRRTFLGAISRALSGQSHVLHGAIEFVSRQIFPNTAEDEYLLRWGSVWGIERLPATKAELQIKILGDVGSVIPDLTEWQNSAGAIYTQQGVAEIPEAVAGVAEQTQISTVADVGRNLAGKYFFINSPENEYVVWYRVDGQGADPNLTGKTSIQVDIQENDTANDVANATQSILDSALDLTASATLNNITVVNNSDGSVETATDFNTGFNLTRLIPGVTEVRVEAIVNVISENAGDSTNVDNGEFLSLVSAIAGVESDAEVLSTVFEGEDIESFDNFRNRLLSRIQEPPSGGNVNDYEQEALKVGGVTRAWVYPNFEGVGTGTVGVTFVEDNENPIIPNADKVAEVQSWLTRREFKPVTAKVTAFAPTPLTIDLVIKIQPNTQAVRDSVTTSLNDLIFRDAAPKGAYSSPGSVFDGKILLSRINEAISIANGEEDHEIVTINGSAPENVVPTFDGELCEIGIITWQPLV